MLPYKLRLAGIQDAEVVKDLAQNFLSESSYDISFNDTVFLNSFKTYVSSPNHVIILLGDPVVGMLSGKIDNPLFSLDKIAFENAWYVYPEYRGIRGSLELLKAFEFWARKQGCAAIQMTCLMGKYAGIGKIYERNGYTKHEEGYLKCL